MASTIDVEELIARPLDVIARLRGELKARDATTNSGGEESALLAEAISDGLCSGSSPALAKVPLLSRESLAEVCAVHRPVMCVRNSTLRRKPESGVKEGLERTQQSIVRRAPS